MRERRSELQRETADLPKQPVVHVARDAHSSARTAPYRAFDLFAHSAHAFMEWGEAVGAVLATVVEGRQRKHRRSTQCATPIRVIGAPFSLPR